VNPSNKPLANDHKFYLPVGLPIPVAEPDGLSAPYWNGLRDNRLMVQRCKACATWQFAPEWICHRCHQFDPDWVQVEPKGRIFSWERSWHPVHPCLANRGPYLAVVVELPDAGNIRMLGNLLGAPTAPVEIGADVVGTFEHHLDAQPAFTLLQWKYANG
jgi:uncharacterized protein